MENHFHHKFPNKKLNAVMIKVIQQAFNYALIQLHRHPITSVIHDKVGLGGIMVPKLDK